MVHIYIFYIKGEVRLSDKRQRSRSQKSYEEFGIVIERTRESILKNTGKRIIG